MKTLLYFHHETKGGLHAETVNYRKRIHSKGYWKLNS